ncbi:MAG: hypothetical protein ACKVP2_06745 [Burkholderiales bacterium]
MSILEISAPVLGWLWKLLGLLQDVVARAHIGTLVEPEEQRGNYYFLTVTNRSPKRNAVVTHVIFDADGTDLPVINPNIRMPAELRPEQVWHTHLRLDALLPKYQQGAEDRFVVYLSSGKRVRSQKAESVPGAGIFSNTQ